ncbi:hypothetical protein niasHT_008719 [Heterodera trifolii]|uniref:Uncharacterized protein n=1 Tax=Heterodera trifolii TaxID=157864 RepID=A0ABD2M247_9BILA
MSSPLGANVFITGANRGIGLGLVKKMLTELQQLYDKNGPLRLIRIDVSDDRSIRMAFGQVQKQLLDKGGLNLADQQRWAFFSKCVFGTKAIIFG